MDRAAGKEGGGTAGTGVVARGEVKWRDGSEHTAQYAWFRHQPAGCQSPQRFAVVRHRPAG